MNKVRTKLKFDCCFSVNKSGLGGGLAMLWNLDIEVNIASFSCHHIDAEVCTEKGKNLRCTWIYGSPEASQKRHTWSLLRRLASLSSSLWLYCSDFNEILHLNEKKGNDRVVRMINDFRDTVKDSSLVDMGFSRRIYTWLNKRYEQQYIDERLDRCLCCINWKDHFHDLVAVHLESWTLDHSPIIMEVVDKHSELSYTRKSFRRIHYEDFWNPYEACQEIIKEEWLRNVDWKEGNLVQAFSRAATKSMMKLKWWSRNEFEGNKKKMKNLVTKLRGLKQNTNQEENGEEIKLVEKQIDNMLMEEEIY